VLTVLPGTDRRLSLEGVIRYVRDEIQLHYAVELLGTPPEARQLLQDFVAAQLRGPTTEGRA
jgi:hypothetical protein